MACARLAQGFNTTYSLRCALLGDGGKKIRPVQVTIEEQGGKLVSVLQ